MKVITKLPPRNCPSSEPKRCLAIGNFDGVHIGHQGVIRTLRETARKVRGLAAILTFENHPRTVLNPAHAPSLLTCNDERFSLLARLGVTACFLVRFTKRFSRLSAEDFVREVLVKRLNVHTVYLGSNARFGRGREGDARLMKALARRFGFRFHPIPSFKVGKEVVNSTRIRALISQGKLKKAEQMLGRKPTLTGVVVSGEQRGRSLGFPTANLNIQSGVLPPRGVYIVKADMVHYSRRIVKEGFIPCERTVRTGLTGLLNVGYRPTFHRRKIVTLVKVIPEVYLMNFSGKLYGKLLKLHLIKHLRREKKFNDAADLIHQIRRDVRAVRKYAKNVKNKAVHDARRTL